MAKSNKSTSSTPSNTKIISLSHEEHRVTVAGYHTENEIIYHFFKNLPSDEYDDKFVQAFRIGVMALMEDRLAAFLARTEDELGAHLENLKFILRLEADTYKTPQKGAIGEKEVLQALTDYFTEHRWCDEATLTGNTENPDSPLPGNKTGDIVCHVDGKPEHKIVLEIKLDESYALGEVADKDQFTKKETAWSQLLEAGVNRCAAVSIIVFDRSSINAALRDSVEGVAYYPAIGLVAITDLSKGDFTNLKIAYKLARDMVLHIRCPEYDPAILRLLVQRIVKDINAILKIQTYLKSIDDSTDKIRLTMGQSLVSMEFSMAYLNDFLEKGNLSQQSLLEFYTAGSLRDKMKVTDINAWLDGKVQPE